MLKHFGHCIELQKETQMLWLACSDPQTGAKKRPPGWSSLLQADPYSMVMPARRSIALWILHAWLEVSNGNALAGLIRWDKRWFAQTTICRGPCCASRSVHGGDLVGRGVLHAMKMETPAQRGVRDDFPWKRYVKNQCNARLHWSLYSSNYTGQSFPQPLSEPPWRRVFFTTWHM